MGASPEVKSHQKSPKKRRTHLEIRVNRVEDPLWGASPPVMSIHALENSQFVCEHTGNCTRHSLLGDVAILAVARAQMFVRTNGRRVETCPISGTITRGETPIEDAANIKVGKLPQNRCATIP